MSKRAAHPPQSSSLQNSSNYTETDYIRRPLYILLRVFLLLEAFFVIGVAPAAARAFPQQAGIDPIQTTSSFNWWPYPAWGASSLSDPVLMTAVSSALATTQITMAAISSDSVILSSSNLGTPSIAGDVATTTESTTGTSGSDNSAVQLTTLLPSAPSSSRDASTASSHPTSFKPIYLLPVTIIGGAILGACVTALLYSRWYSVRKPLRHNSTSGRFPANQGYLGVEDWEDEEDKRDEEEKQFIAQSDHLGGDSRVGGGRNSNGTPSGYNYDHPSISMPVPAVARHSTQSSGLYPQSKAKSGARATRTRKMEYDDVDSWYGRKDRIEGDSSTGLSDEEPPSPYARLSDFRKPRDTTSGRSRQELPDYEQDDPAQSLLPTGVDRPGVFRRRVTPIQMRGHGRTDSNIVIRDVLRVPDRPLEGILLPPSPASVYPEDGDSSFQNETPPLPRPSNNPPPWSPVYEIPHSRALSSTSSQLVPSNLSVSNPPRFSTVGTGDSLDLNLVLEDERGPRVPPKRTGKVNKDFPASVSASSTFVNPPSRFARKPEQDSQQAFSKVDDILRRSWDQRDVDSRPSSPTRFGAIIIDDRSDVQRPLYGARPMRSGDGTRTGQVNFRTVREGDESIEQQLANLRRKDNRFNRT